MKRLLTYLPALLLFAALGFTAQQDEDAALLKRAEKLHNKIIAIDTHTDTALSLVKDNMTANQLIEYIKKNINGSNASDLLYNYALRVSFMRAMR